MFLICQWGPSPVSVRRRAVDLLALRVDAVHRRGEPRGQFLVGLRGAASSLCCWSLGWASAGLSTAGASKRRSMVSLVLANRLSCSTVKTGGRLVPSPVTTLPLAKSSMVDEAQVGRRLARARWPLRAFGASAVAATASAMTLFSIMLTLGQTGAAAPFFAGRCAGPRRGPVGDACK